MKVHQGASNFRCTNGTVVTIGTFDGVHLGHKAILKRLVEASKKNKLDSVLLTFFPHPRMVLQNDADLKLLNTLNEKEILLEAQGIDHLVVHPFTKEFSRLTAEEFVRDILVHQLKAKKIIIGYDHRFGRNRNANIDNLREYGIIYGFQVEEISAKELDDVAISSTKIRNALNDGDIEMANTYLGYPYKLQGVVVRGKGLGKKLGFPTANLELEESYKLIPKNGVYVTRAQIKGQWRFGLTSIGTNPTVGGTCTTIETYFLKTRFDLYDEYLQLEFLTWIREEKTFESLDALKKAIAADEHFAKEFLDSNG